MEENEISWELNSSISALVFIETMTISTETITHLLSSLSYDPLFSCIITLYTLILLYFPPVFIKIALSPVLILTSILLLSLLRLGAIQKTQTHIEKNGDNNENDEKIQNFADKIPTEDDGNNENKPRESQETEETEVLQEVHKWVTCKAGYGSEPELGFAPDQGFEERFVEWDVRAPLEVIYEEFNEGECEEQETKQEEDEKEEEREYPNPKEKNPNRMERYPSLSFYYPETDSDSDVSMDGDSPVIGEWGSSPENTCFRWEEDDREGLIEIALDGNYYNNNNKREIGFHFEEENLIEIDISPLKNNEFNVD